MAANPSFDLTCVFGGAAADLVARVVAALRRAVPVEEVWLFGSCARGDAKPDSDLDLLVVLADDHGLARPNLACFKAVNHLPEIPPADVLAISRSRWQQERARPFGLFGEAAEQGICLYAK
jgi:predicted nucleotidyltransferase